MTQPDNNIFFKEVQQFRQKWIWILVLSIAFSFWLIVLYQVSLEAPFQGFLRKTLWGFWLLFGIGFPLFLYSLKMVTEINNNGIKVAFFPIIRNYYFKDLQMYTIKRYEPPFSGGWGISPGMINVSGHWGAELSFKNGEKMLIGSQYSEELVKAIETAMKLNTRSNLKPVKLQLL